MVIHIGEWGCGAWVTVGEEEGVVLVLVWVIEDGFSGGYCGACWAACGRLG